MEWLGLFIPWLLCGVAACVLGYRWFGRPGSDFICMPVVAFGLFSLLAVLFIHVDDQRIEIEDLKKGRAGK